MQSRIGTPILPQAATRLPAASNIAAASWVVVVLPLVPVMVTHLATFAVLSRKRHAKSTSTQTGILFSPAHRMIAESGLTPGEVTTNSGLNSTNWFGTPAAASPLT
ncbi:unannotated protein [freshwater metagenome]|uniref:Unannotated protein n=1 Tax=freshwater metagenome TaxID=449393 RepID=A0A6J6AYU2_9ZZZZ